MSFVTLILITWMLGSIQKMIIIGLSILIKKKFIGILPLWFSKWWGQYGAIPDILSLNISKAFGAFRDSFNVDAYGKKFSPMMHFVIKFKISWILKWNYVKEGDILDRHWFEKLWDKFPQTDVIIQTVYKDFVKKNASSTTPAATPRTINTRLVTPSLLLPPPEEKKTADEKPTVDASSSSSKTKKSKKKKKGPFKKDMRMFQQFLKTFKEENDTEESEDKENLGTSSSASGNSLCGENHSLFRHDPLCSQDSISVLRTFQHSTIDPHRSPTIDPRVRQHY